MDEKLRAYQRLLKTGAGNLEQYLRLVEQSGQVPPWWKLLSQAESVRKYILNGGTLVRTNKHTPFEQHREPILSAITWLLSQNLAHRALIVCTRVQMTNWIRLIRAADLNFTGVLGYKQIDRLLGAGSFAPITLISYDVLVRVVPEVLKQLGPAAESWWPIIVCDDAELLHRHTTARHKAVVNLAKMGGAKTRIAIASTPVTDSLLDIYSIFKFVEPSVFPSTIQEFVAEFMEFSGESRYPVPQQYGLARVLDRVKNNCLDIRNID